MKYHEIYLSSAKSISSFRKTMRHKIKYYYICHNLLVFMTSNLCHDVWTFIWTYTRVLNILISRKYKNGAALKKQWCVKPIFMLTWQILLIEWNNSIYYRSILSLHLMRSIELHWCKFAIKKNICHWFYS